MPSRFSTPSGGVSLRGDKAEVYAHGQYAGHLKRWRLQGLDGAWEAWAERYVLDPFLMDGRRVRLRFVLHIGGVEAELWAEGEILSPFTADNHIQREELHLKGGQLWQKVGAAQRT